MAIDQILETGVFPVNQNGEIVLQSGTGTTNVVGYINSSQVPTDVSTNKMVVKLPVDVPQMQIDSANNVTGISATKASGIKYPFTRPMRTIARIGDSRSQLADQFGTYFNTPTNINNNGAVPSVRASLACPSGTGTIRYFAATKTMSWQWGGDATPGPEVAVKDGIFTLTTATSNANIEIRVIARILPTIDKQDTITASATKSWRRLVGSGLYATDALTRSRFIFKNYGISGSSSIDVSNHYQDVINSGADVIIDETGTNDIIALTMAPATSAAIRASNWDKALAMGIPVLAHLIAPRGGVGTITSESALTATQAFNISTANKLYIENAKKRPGVYIIDSVSKTVKVGTTIMQIKDFYTTDGVHDSGGLAYEVAECEANILNILCPDDSLTMNVGAGSYYNATSNITGNLMPVGQAWFSGTGGVANTGVTVGTGLAAGFTISRSIGSSASAVANKATATDGGADWQEFVVSGATQAVAQGVKNETFLMYSGYPSNGNFSAGDLVTGSVEYEISGAGCTGIQFEVLLTVTPGIQWQAFQLGEVVQGIRKNGVIALEPITWQPNISGVLPRILFSSKEGATFTIRFRNLDLRKVVAS